MRLLRVALLLLLWGALLSLGVGAEAHRAHDEAAAEATVPDAPVDPSGVVARDGPGHDAAEGGHGKRHREMTGLPKLLAWLGNFHPSTVHFPIALLVMAAVGELLSRFGPSQLFRQGARFCVWGAALAAVPVACLGWLFAGFALVDEDWILTTHRWLGTATAVWAAIVLVLGERAQRAGAGRGPYLFALLAGAALVSATGFFGGALVYGLDHYAW